VPVLHDQLGEKAITQPPIAGIQHCADIALGIEAWDASRRFFIDGRTERESRLKGRNAVSDIDVYLLGVRDHPCCKNKGEG